MRSIIIVALAVGVLAGLLGVQEWAKDVRAKQIVTHEARMSGN